MTIIEAFQNELEQEAVITRKMLSQIPDDQYDFQPHERSMSLQTLANHIAELPGWIGYTLNADELDFAKDPYTPTQHNQTAKLLSYFEEVLDKARKDLANAEASQLGEMWTLRDGDTIFVQESKWSMLRMSFSQIIHHRAQLGVYLRLLDIPIPGSYGPSADEAHFAEATV